MTDQDRQPVEEAPVDDELDVQGHDMMTEELARLKVREQARQANRTHRSEARDSKSRRSWLDRLTGR